MYVILIKEVRRGAWHSYPDLFKDKDRANQFATEMRPKNYQVLVRWVDIEGE